MHSTACCVHVFSQQSAEKLGMSSPLTYYFSLYLEEQTDDKWTCEWLSHVLIPPFSPFLPLSPSPSLLSVCAPFLSSPSHYSLSLFSSLSSLPPFCLFLPLTPFFFPHFPLLPPFCLCSIFIFSLSLFPFPFPFFSRLLPPLPPHPSSPLPSVPSSTGS